MRIERILPVIASRLRALAVLRSPLEACGVVTAAGGLVELPNRSLHPDLMFDVGPLHEIEVSGAVAAIWHTHAEDTAPGAADLAGCRASDLPWVVSGPSKIWVIYPEPRPLAGRDFVYGEDDCWTLVADWYAQRRGVLFPWFERPPDGWWKEPGESPYVTAAASYGFDQPALAERDFDAIEVGDVLLMQVLGRRPNHVAVYVGGGQIVHHMYGQLSRTEFLDSRFQRLTTTIARLK